MKKAIFLIALVLALTVLFSGCSLLFAVGTENPASSESETSTRLSTPAPTAAPTATPTAAPTATPSPTPTAEPTPTPTPTAEPTPTPTPVPQTEPIDEILDTMWVAYNSPDSGEHHIYLLNFYSDGSMYYGAGWVKSEFAYSGKGQWTADGNKVNYDIEMDGLSLHGTLKFTLVAGDNLVISHVSGDPLCYLLNSGNMEFVVQGSSMDIPPI